MHSRKSDRFVRKTHTPLTLHEAKLRRQPRKRTISDDVSSLPVEKPVYKTPSPAQSIPSSCSDDLSSSVGCYPVLGKNSRGSCCFLLYRHMSMRSNLLFLFCYYCISYWSVCFCVLASVLVLQWNLNWIESHLSKGTLPRQLSEVKNY